MFPNKKLFSHALSIIKAKGLLIFCLEANKYIFSVIKGSVKLPSSYCHQNKEIKLYYPNQIEKLVVFLVPYPPTICGGLRMTYKLSEEFRKLNSDSKTLILNATFPSRWTYSHNPYLHHNGMVFRYSQIAKEFHSLTSLEIYLPECMSDKFYSALTLDEILYLKKIPNLKLFIFNQNPSFLPPSDRLNSLYELTDDIVEVCDTLGTITQDRCNEYGYPIHYLPVLLEQADYKRKTHAEKENTIVLSNDCCTFGKEPTPENIAAGKKLRQNVIDKLTTELPEFKQIVVQNMKYEDYKNLISNSKYTITFGEGFDLYYTESTLSGSIVFTVYYDFVANKSLLNYDNIFVDYSEMAEKIVDVIKEYERNPEKYTKDNRELSESILQKIGSRYHEDIIKLYRGEYTIYPDNHKQN